MSAIFGFVIKDTLWQMDSLRRMSQALRHRGADEEWYANLSGGKTVLYRGKEGTDQSLPLLDDEAPAETAMGYRGLRLSSTELETPVWDPEAEVALAFDGTIYNRKELAKQLNFYAENDTALLLNAYKQWGIGFVKRLNGMFAIELYDRATGMLYLIRDHHGTIPLFYYQSGRRLLWSSEIKGIMASGQVKGAVSMPGLLAVYYLQSPIPPATCFEHIYQLPPASWLAVNTRDCSVQLQPYWDVPFGKTVYHASFGQAAAEFAERLRMSVKAATESKAGIASLLSGGLDSALITFYAKEFVPDLSSYTFALDGSGKGNDELPQASRLAQQFNIRQYVHWFREEEVLDNLYGDIRHIEEPYSGIEVFMNTAKYLAAKGCRIILNGAAADHIFGGESALFWQWRWARKFAFLNSFIPAWTPYLRKVKNVLQLDSAWKYFANAQSSMRIYQLRELLKDTPVVIDPAYMTGRDEADFRNEVEALFYHNSVHFTAHNNWRNNLYGMRYGVEMRYPFLDPSLTEWVSGLPLGYRYNAARSKPLIREAVRRTMPHPSPDMPKKGYHLSGMPWIRHGEALDSFLNTNIRQLKVRGIFNPGTIDKWWEQYKADRSAEVRIWLLATTEIWLQTYID